MPALARPRSAAPRLRAFSWFLFAALYGVFAHEMARRFAHLLTPAVRPLASRALLVVLLTSGFAAMGASGQRQHRPLADMGLPGRPGRGGEWALGAALGWGGVVAAVLPLAVAGGLLVSLAGAAGGRVGSGLQVLLASLYAAALLLLSTLTQELLFRGYPFQRLRNAVGGTAAAIVSALVFALERTAGSLSPLTFLNSLLLGFLLTLAYLRTRALWVGWGLNFAWNASLGLLFGLPVNGVGSPAVSTYSTGPTWLSGGGYGPEGALLTTLILFALLPIAARATRDLRHRWALPEIHPAGMPVDLDAAARRQHEAATRPAPTPTPLVQILPAEPHKHE